MGNIQAMPKFLIFLLAFLFVAAPLVAFWGFHDDCQDQVCHILMTNLFILTPAVIILAMFLITQLAGKAYLFEALYSTEIFLPPRF